MFLKYLNYKLGGSFNGLDNDDEVHHHMNQQKNKNPIEKPNFILLEQGK